MKYIKLYESFEDIDSICKNHSIYNYTINSDGTVDVDDDVYLTDEKLIKLPLKFGKVSGDFNCSQNQLTSLEGCPRSVGGHFNCGDNQLTSLEFCPQSVGDDFYCSYNYLTTLEGCPQAVRGDFSCNNNQLTTLEGCPSVGDYFFCGNNQLKDLYGFPEFFDNSIYYNNNPVSEILDLFKTKRLGKVIDLLNEYGVIQQGGKVVILDRLEEVFYTLSIEIPKEIKLANYEV